MVVAKVKEVVEEIRKKGEDPRFSRVGFERKEFAFMSEDLFANNGLFCVFFYKRKKCIYMDKML